MIKKLGTIATCLFFAFGSQAQTTSADAEVVKTKKSFLAVNNQFKKPSKDYIMLQAGFHTWALPSSSNIRLSQRGHDLGAYLCYDFPLARKNFSFAGGAGIGSSNIYLKDQRISLADTSRANLFANFVSDTSYKRFKLSLNYLEFPLEFRYYGNNDNRNRGFKLAIGAKVGTLINAHTKGFTTTAIGNFREKENNRRFFESWRIVPMARIGWGNFSLYGSYQINELFKPVNTQGTGVRPISFGITIGGL
jgi:hypothetical protein